MVVVVLTKDFIQAMEMLQRGWHMTIEMVIYLIKSLQEGIKSSTYGWQTITLSKMWEWSREQKKGIILFCWLLRFSFWSNFFHGSKVWCPWRQSISLANNNREPAGLGSLFVCWLLKKFTKYLHEQMNFNKLEN